MDQYCMFKGKLLRAAPYSDSYSGSPHYVITVAGNDAKPFNIVVNSASTEVGEDGNDEVYFYVDLNFSDPVADKLKDLDLGLYTDGFPRLDYWQDRSLLDLHRMRPIPYEDENGERFSVNSTINQVLSIDEAQDFQLLPYDNGSHELQQRKFWTPTTDGIIVHGFGFLFPQGENGLHETHMNQGNPRSGRHWRENGTFQDGAVIVQQGNNFVAMFTAFQTQLLPTDARGFPTGNARPLPELVGGN
jgi:uncharacterized protein YukJ